ncbi:MAG: helix-turn-helix transcriptional regulator [Rhizobiales bacterium]|nr:helix-turn-helix transcriptional regulator [Hyphomicrobiales bacterium]
MTAVLDTTFSALADPTRRAILSRLADEPRLSVGEIASPFGISLPAISKHLDVLEEAQLVRRIRSGRQVICRLDAAPLEAAMRWLAEYEKFWSLRLDALTALLEEREWQPPRTSRLASSALSKPRRKKSSPPGSRPKR